MVYRPKIDDQMCFVLLPFQDLFVEYFKGIIAPAAAEVGLTAKKADDIFGTRPIIQDIWESIWAAKAVIADVTGKNPNVNYELGVCHALGVPTVLITQDMNDVPFDYRHRRCIRYDIRRVNWQEKLRNDIVSTLKAVLAGEGAHDELRWPYDTALLDPARKVGSFVSAEEAMDSVLRGISGVAESVSRAYGPRGSSVSVARRFGETRGDRSGVVIAQASDSIDPVEKKGIEQAQALAREVSATLGDGTKTAILLFRELVAGGFQAVRNGADLRDLIDSMNSAIDNAMKFLSENIRKMGDGDLLGVAQTASAGDSLSGSIVREALERSGSDGLVYVQESPDTKTSVTVQEGIFFERGFISVDFITDDAKQLAVLTDPYILLYTGKITSMKPLLPVLEEVARSHRPVLIVADDVDGEALATLIVNKKRGAIGCVAVRAPGFQQNRSVLMEDFGVATGGMVIDGAEWALADVGIRHLGQASRVEVSKDGTWIVGGKGDKALIASRAASLRKQIEYTRVEIEKERLQARLAQLVGSTCAIRIGGVSSVDRDDRRYRIQTAMHSAQSAISSGVVPGGGTAIWRAHLQTLSLTTEGATIVATALVAPLLIQIRNARGNQTEITKQMHAKKEFEWGFDATTRAVVNLYNSGILDSSNVILGAIQLAFAHARTVLQVGAWDLTTE